MEGKKKLEVEEEKQEDGMWEQLELEEEEEEEDGK